MPDYRLTRLARQDLAEIGRYTQRRWGPAQRRAYLDRLERRMRLLATRPELGASCDSIRAGYRSFREGRHLIFYRQVGEAIEVRMDVRRHLTGESEETP